EKIHLTKEKEGNMLHGKIELINFIGHLYEYIINCHGQKIRAYKRIKEHEIKDKYKVGMRVYLWFTAENTFAWPAPENIDDELSLE
ncbi:TOBE domain-containing protein, partial [Candidatus Falkowbacteria bacterium]|nr:TOBE domain-containing protein [Candidatus Falkowbacteria bacterium]